MGVPSNANADSMYNPTYTVIIIMHGGNSRICAILKYYLFAHACMLNLKEEIDTVNRGFSYYVWHSDGNNNLQASQLQHAHQMEM